MIKCAFCDKDSVSSGNWLFDMPCCADHEETQRRNA
jgi:hypothetical protein